MLERLNYELTHDAKFAPFPEQRESIGQRAAELIPPNANVYLDAGTTALAIVHHLANRTDLLVITNDFVTAHFLITQSPCPLIHIGGSVNKANRSSVGELAASMLLNLSVNIAFISTSSWNFQKLITPDDNKSPVKKDIAKAARKRILVSDSSNVSNH